MERERQAVRCASCCLGMVARVPVACALSSTRTFQQEPGITKIRHVIVIMLENRSFDACFGTY